MNIEITAKRLKQLREENKLSHAKLKVALKEKYNLDISEASLKNYEVFDKYHSNYGCVSGMKIEFLYTFAKIYNVSTDYLLGFSDSRSTKITERVLYDTYGISQKSLLNMKNLWNATKELVYDDVSLSYPIDFALSDKNFMIRFSNLALRYCKTKEESIGKETSSDMYIATQTLKYIAISEVERVIEKLYNDLQNIPHDKKYLHPLPITWISKTKMRGKRNENE